MSSCPAMNWLLSRSRVLTKSQFSLLKRKFVFPFLVFLAGRAWGGQETGPDFSKLAPASPCAELTAEAQARRIPLEGLDASGEPGRLDPGDSFTALVTLCEKGGRRTQWLLYLETLPPKPKQPAGKSPKPMVIYSWRSNKFEFASTPALVRLRTLGPFAGTGAKREKLEDHSVSFSLDKGFLGLGLDVGAATIYRSEQQKAKGFLWFGPELPSAAQAAEGRQLAEVLGVTPAEERALGGMFPALFSYFQVVQHTQGLEAMMLRVIDKPSLWSVVRHLGVSVNLVLDSEHLSPADTASWPSLARPSAYYFPMRLELNHRPALRATFVVTNPRPPLLSCGGVIGMLAERPGDKETYLTLRIISARRAAGSGTGG